MKTATLTNSFHNTSVKIDARWLEEAQEQQVTVMNLLFHEGFDNNDPSAKRTYRRVSKVLCGNKTCMCGIVR